MSYAIVRTDNIAGTDVRAQLVSVKYMGADGQTPTAIENGNVILLDQLVNLEREIYTAKTVASDSPLGSVVLVATPELMYDERDIPLDKFINKAGRTARAYHLHKGGIFSVTAEALDGTGAVGKVVELEDDSTKLKVSDSATDGATQVGMIIEEDRIGGYDYFAIKIGAHNVPESSDTQTSNTISPSRATFDINEDGADHKDIKFYITTANSGVTIEKLYLQQESEPDPETDIEAPDHVNDVTLWAVSTAESGAAHLLTLYPVLFDEQPEGEMPVYALMSDGSIVSATIYITDTTEQEPIPTPPTDIISPATATFDLNPNGANHRDVVLTVTPAIAGTEIDKLQFFDEDEQEWQDVPQTIDALTIWSLDASKLVLTVYVAAFMEHPAGTELTAAAVLTDGTKINVTVTIEDTTGG